MSKYKSVLLTALLGAAIFALFLFWLIETQWMIFYYTFVVGMIITLIQREARAHRFVDGIVIGTLVYSVLVFFALYLRSVIHPYIHYATVLEFVFSAFSFFLFTVTMCFFGGLTGIILKGLYVLYGTLSERLLLFVGPIALMVASLCVYFVHIGGTVQYAVHGWPYGFLMHQIKDVLSGDRIDRWSLFAGTLFWHLIAAYLFYFAIFLTVRYFVISAVRNRGKKKSYSVVALFATLILLALALTAVPLFRHEAVWKEIRSAQVCTQDSDCISIGSHPAFSCWIVVHASHAQEIRSALKQIPEDDDSFSCESARELTPACEAGRCTVK